MVSDVSKSNPKLTLLPLIALIFYEVSGGPFGIEDSIRAGGGPLLSILGFLIFPLIWSIPEALEGFWKWFSGVMDNALYPVLFLDYLKHSLPIFDQMIARIPALLVITILLTYLNYRGLHVVGFSAILLAVFSLFPFLIMAVLAIPRIRPSRWLIVDFKVVDVRGYFNSMFWNLNYWDKASTLAGEIENPSKTFPKALLGAVVLVVSSYLVPLLAGTGAFRSEASEWADGYFAEVGMSIGGFWLKVWIQVAAAMSNLGLFEAEMTSDAFQLLGMSKMGFLPAVFGSRSKYGTPTISILFSATGVIFLSWMTFLEIVELLNYLYAFGMLLELAAFIALRLKRPDLHRPYKVPLQTFGAAMMCLPSALLLIFVICLATWRTFFVSAAIVAVGFILYPLLVQARNRKWLAFEAEPSSSFLSNGCLQSHSALSELDDPEILEEDSVELLSSSKMKSGEE
ncbi:hypothetical protein K1719_001246 [Acacia pycnantha]|nr:hypothetical protein K1719_001246 [Acacia pycnantha]